MNAVDLVEIPIETEYDIVTTRRIVREAATNAGFGITDITRIVTAASELARNIHLYARSGTVSCRTIIGHRTGLEVVFADHGPGIADVDQAMVPGYTSGNGLGMGLPGAKRLMDEMDVRSSPGDGTTVVIRKWLRT